MTTRYLVDDLNPTGYAQVAEEVAGGRAAHLHLWQYARQPKQLGSGQTSFMALTLTAACVS